MEVFRAVQLLFTYSTNTIEFGHNAVCVHKETKENKKTKKPIKRQQKKYTTATIKNQPKTKPKHKKTQNKWHPRSSSTPKIKYNYTKKQNKQLTMHRPNIPSTTQHQSNASQPNIAQTLH
jgi:hypothetical protein